MEWLLTVHDCVVIPGLGAVLAHRQCAVYDSVDGSLCAPCRTYTFNAGLKEGDGLLEQSIARAQRISYRQAQAIVADEVTAMLSQLNTEGEVSLGRAGSLRLDTADGTLAFVGNGTDALTPLALWLPERVEPATAAQPAAQDHTPIITPPQPRWYRALRVAAITAAVVAVGMVVSTPIVVNNANFASTTPPAISAPRYAYVPTPASQAVMDLPMTAPAPTAVDTAARYQYQREHTLGATPATAIAAKAEQPKAQQPKAQAAPAINDAGAYCVVVASLANDSQANEFIDQAAKRYKGELGILRQGKYTRVYAASASTAAQAQKMLNSLASTFEGAWICRR